MSDPGRLSCPECEFTSSKEKRLVKHVRKSHGKTAVRCPLCVGVHYSSSPEELCVHKKQQHRSMRLRCFLCEFSSRSLDRWANHVTCVHRGHTASLVNLLASVTDISSSGCLPHPESTVTVRSMSECVPSEAIGRPKSEQDLDQICRAMADPIPKLNLEENPDPTMRSNSGQDLDPIERPNSMWWSDSEQDPVPIRKSNSEQDLGPIGIPNLKQNPEHSDVSSGECVTPYPEPMDFRETPTYHFQSEQASDVVTTDSAATNSHSVTEFEENGIQSDHSDISSSFCDIEVFPYTTTSSSRHSDIIIKSETLPGHGFTKDSGVDSDIKCPFCSLIFPTIKKLSLHCKIEHGKNSRYRCTYCEYSCKSVAHLIRHLRTHTGEKPFSCWVCPYRSSTKGAMVEHVRTHTNERPYKCTLCDFSAKTANGLIRHVRVHTNERPYSCHQCDRAFKLWVHLNAHMRIHTNERSYLCSVCDYSARDKATLTSHMRVHTKEKPFQCDLCFSSFTQMSSLNRHKVNGVCTGSSKIYLFS